MEKGKIILSILGIAFLVAIVFGSTYAIFTFSKAGTKENKITTGTVSMTYTEGTTGITLTNATPTTDANGKNLSGTNNVFDFTVSATITGTTTINYDVYAEKTSGSTLDEKYVKIYLTDGATTETAMTGYTTVPVYSGLTAMTGSSTQKKLYSGTLTNTKTSQKFRLRLWLLSTYTDNTTAKTFGIKVGVKATQKAS